LAAVSNGDRAHLRFCATKQNTACGETLPLLANLVIGCRHSTAIPRIVFLSLFSLRRGIPVIYFVYELFVLQASNPMNSQKNIVEGAEYGEMSPSQKETDLFRRRVMESLRQIIRAVDVYSRKINSLHGITVPQIMALRTLESDGPMTLSALAHRVQTGLSTANGIIDRLEAKGLLSRARDQEDHRKVTLRILPDGKAVCSKAPPLLPEKFCEMLDSMPELERATLALSLERLVELMAWDRLEPAAETTR
jgi:MarR family transcriptional regulator, organic hydroperoxide resistance regulator